MEGRYGSAVNISKYRELESVPCDQLKWNTFLDAMQDDPAFAFE